MWWERYDGVGTYTPVYVQSEGKIGGQVVEIHTISIQVSLRAAYLNAA